MFLSNTAETASPIYKQKAETEERATDRMKNLIMIDGFFVLFLVVLAGLFVGLTFYLKKRFRPRNTFRW